MWIRRDELRRELNNNEIRDWVEIDGTIWVEIADEKGVQHVQPSIKREFGKNTIQIEACLEEADD